jgi:carbonic anhydrase
MTATDDAVLASRRWRDQHFPGDGSLPVAPGKHLAVVACMDSRLDIFGLLGLGIGEAHVIRNAGGIITDDMLRSLAISQRKLGTREIILVHHTDCGLQKVTDEEFAEELEQDTGTRPTWTAGAFTDPAESVRESMRRIRQSPYVPNRGDVRGFVYHVESGELREVH